MANWCDCSRDLMYRLLLSFFAPVYPLAYFGILLFVPAIARYEARNFMSLVFVRASLDAIGFL